MSVDELLNGIILSLGQTEASVLSAQQKFITESEELLPTMVKDLLAKSSEDLEGMSLLSLKENALLSYVNNLVLVLLAHLERMQEGTDSEKLELLKLKAVQSTVEQRACLEKGVKPLEKKLSYQLEKMVRSFHRMEEDNAKLEAKINEQVENGTAEPAESESDSDSESDSEEDEDALSYKPDSSALAKMTKKPYKKKESEADEKYRPPKISAAAPPRTFSDKAAPKNHTRKLQSMEEYLAESSDLPQAESSIGATILDHGRGGVKTAKDTKREKEIQKYEESNFTRLPSTATKKTFKQKMAERTNNFAGEDWSMFNNKRNLKEGTSRKRKAGSAWDRVKRRQN
ncbi:CIC11C00000002906 [Sungouiella intermedia]|uniref:CIC11C00000002906 n=1 Tax=Sungouiella intermedia TaxID=45354 RepID=A0A1L0BDA0_9ASCO|nr:CIC11C00000002906 [[Candida] intermedia]